VHVRLLLFSPDATHNGTGQQDPHGHKPQGEATGKVPGVATVSNALGDFKYYKAISKLLKSVADIFS